MVRKHLIMLATLAVLAAGAGRAVWAQHKQKQLLVTGNVGGLLLDGVACNATEAARTWTSRSGETAGYRVLVSQLNFTYNAATALAIDCQASLTGGTDWAEIYPCDDTTDGSCHLTSDGDFDITVSADTDFIFRWDFLGAGRIRCIVSCTGGGASDTFSMYGRLSE